MSVIKNRRGISLLESVVALTIVSMTVVGALDVVSGQLRLAARSRRALEAEALASVRMDEMGLLTDPELQALPDTVEKGKFDPPMAEYSWEAVSEPSEYLPGVYNVTLRILWPDNAYTVHTCILPPAAGKDGVTMKMNRAGMTLVEVLVTLFVVGIVMASGTLAFTQIIDHKQVVKRANESAERGAALREMIHAWLYSGTVNRVTNQQVGTRSAQQTVLINGQVSLVPAVVSGDALNFVTSARTPLSSDSSTMRLFIDDDTATPEQGLTLEYRANIQTPLYRVQLDTTITFMTVEYRDTRTRGWVASIDAASVVPIAMKMTLFSSDTFSVSGIVGLPIVIPMGANPTATPGQTTPPPTGGL